MPRHRPLLIAFQRGCFALLLAPGLAAAVVADDAKDGRGTTSGMKEVERRLEQPPRATPGAVAERSFGVVPQLSPIVTAGRWQPLLNEVSRQTSVSLRFTTASGITRFEERVLAGKYDFVYLNSLLFQEAQKSRGYRALVRDEQPLQGIIVVRQDGPQSLAELGGKTLVFPSPRAFGATLLTRADLKRLDIPHDVSYLGTHESVYQDVAQGRHVAGGGVLHSFELLPAAQRQGLRILHTTAPVMAHVIAVHPRVPASEAERVRQTLLKLHEQPVGAAQLGKLGMRRLVVAVPADFESVRGLSWPVRPPALAFHIIPRLDAEATRQYLQPLATYMRQRLELDVQTRVYGNMDDFEKAIYGPNAAALINANPAQAVRLVRAGYDIIAHELPAQSPGGMHAVILVHRDSPYRTLADLRGRRIAFGGGAHAFFASVVPRAMLKQAELAGSDYTDVSRPGPVTNVLQLLSDDEADAAAIGTLALYNKALRAKYRIEERLRVLAQSEAMPGVAWLVGPRLDPGLRDEIRRLLLQFDADAPGHAAMQAAGIERLLPADNNTYRGISAYLETTADR